ncbi:MAG: WXG100 family type VII secretion target [Lachnospiraceae bacterium]|nr:WXG100 family type VII secretion target [Lachnospiraceae bacterium]MBR2275265.1 WXG100 family type VII secretion target [Lachnospiraceae bacterium]
MEGILKVTPEKLIQASNEFSQTGKTISSLTSEMLSIVNGLKSIWQGEAAESYSSRFASLQDDIEKINRIIQEHVSDLNEMAREYQNAENASLEASSSLMSDIVN